MAFFPLPHINLKEANTQNTIRIAAKIAVSSKHRGKSSSCQVKFDLLFGGLGHVQFLSSLLYDKYETDD